ncbi:MAG: TonB-dependent receptor [Bacteroidia bacterium]|nr:TonB-dependent receptor [Bacteroidia bacterium]
MRLIWLPELTLSQVADYTLSPLVIEAERPLRLKRWIRDSAGWSAVGDHIAALLAQTEGVYLRDYGGQGSLKTLSIRGMGAPLTAVSVQGMPLRAPTLGLVNLAPFFLPGLHTVEYAPGGNLGLSPGAIGLLHLRWQPERHRSVGGWRVGSYGEISAYTLYERPSLLLQASALSALNRYPFSQPERGLREGAEYRYLQATWAYRYRACQVTGWGYSSDQSIPPPVLGGAVGGPTEHLSQRTLIHTLEVPFPRGTLRFQHFTEAVDHRDAFQQLSTSRLHTLQAQLQQEVRYKAIFSGYMLYLAGDWVRSNRTAVGFSPIPQIAQYEGALIGFSHWQKRSAYLRGEARLTALSRFRPLGSFLLRAGWHGIGMEIMQGVRFPSLWERYWVGYGNPTLPPERSIQAQAFVEKSGQVWRIYASVFVAQTRNRIVTIPLSPVRWQAYSLGYVESVGSEGRLEGYLGRLKVWISATTLSAKEYSFTQGAVLPYTPPFMGGMGLIWTLKHWRILYQSQYISWRTSSLAPSRYTLLNPYHLHAMNFVYIRGNWKIELGAENVLSASYQVIQGYPMPPKLVYLRWEGLSNPR